MRSIVRFSLLVLGPCIVLTACDGDGSGGLGGKASILGCTTALQKQAVADLMQEWYLFNDEPGQQQKYAALDLARFATADELLETLLYRPDRYDRHFSFLTTLEADRQFFGEGRFVGFGFGSKYADSPTNADLRLTQVFDGSPAAAAGFERGQRILSIDGRSIAAINAEEGLTAALGPSEVGVTRRFGLRRLDGSEFEAEVAKNLVTSDPIPSAKTLTAGSTTVGYLDVRTFVSTADDRLEQVFADFEAAGVTALVVDLRYNGGGLVATAQHLEDLIAGFVASGQVQSRTLYNDAKSTLDFVTRFQQRAASLSLLQQVVFITTPSSASASELVINALKPHMVVRLVGSATFGKPVGQNALGYCGGSRLLRAVSFETVNALGEGGYYDGLPVDCPADDELARPLGDPTEASLASALDLIETGSCPAFGVTPKPAAGAAALADVPLGPDAAHARRYAGGF